MCDAGCDAGPLSSIVWANFLASGWFVHCYFLSCYFFSYLPSVSFFPVTLFILLPKWTVTFFPVSFFPTCPLLLSFLLLFSYLKLLLSFLFLFFPLVHCYFLSCYLFSCYFLSMHRDPYPPPPPIEIIVYMRHWYLDYWLIRTQHIKCEKMHMTRHLHETWNFWLHIIN